MISFMTWTCLSKETTAGTVAPIAGTVATDRHGGFAKLHEIRHARKCNAANVASECLDCLRVAQVAFWTAFMLLMHVY